MHPLKILSFGAGAIGTYIGGSLAMAGHQVVLLEQPVVAVGLRSNGLRLNLGIDPRRKTQDEFTLTLPAVQFADSLPEALSHGPFDVVLFALKSYDTPAALESGLRLTLQRDPRFRG